MPDDSNNNLSPPFQIRKRSVEALLLLAILFSSCDKRPTKTMEVTATAFNSFGWQTHRDHPTLTAWGDTLKPGMKAIAVSRDLIDSGLTHNTEVKIEGLPGKYLVKDKMNRRWKKRIDIYMETDLDSARSWGKQTVNISWKMPREME